MKRVLVAVLFAASHSLYAAGLGQQASVIEEVLVTAEAGSALSAQSAQQAILELRRIPGGIGLVRSEDYLSEFTQSIGDALEFTPGVFADTSAQRENRISIRGSGANSTFERRGITVLRDGVPISRASGITEFQEIDPLSIDYIEVFKGSNGLRYGAASLGGAINIVTPTGLTSKRGTQIRLEGGSFDTFRSHVNTSGKEGKRDYYAGLTKLDSNGFREHAEVDSVYSFGNIGIRLSEGVETRFYLTALQDNFELAGAVSLDQALNDPERSPDVNILLDQDRNLDVYRLSNKTAFVFDAFELQVGSWIAQRELDHAITDFVGIITQDETELGFSLALDGNADVGIPLTWTLGANYAESETDALILDFRDREPFPPFRATSAAVGDVISDDDQDASNTVVYGQLDFALSETLNLIVSTQYIRSSRDNENIFNADPDQDSGGPGDDTGSLDFDAFNTRLGLLYALNDNTQLYFNISEGYEPPGISDLTAGGSDPFTELEAQESLTYEIGSRGRWRWVSWDATVFRSEIENEFIDIAAPGFGGTVSNTINAEGDTIHQGLELGADIRLSNNLLWRNIYSYNDFAFDNDPGNANNANNALPAIPDSIYITELKYSQGDRWYVGVNVRHIPRGAFADFANTERVPGYEIVGAIGGFAINKSVSVFASAENLSDETFIANISTVADLSTASNSDIFTPGEGRAFYIGLTAEF